MTRTRTLMTGAVLLLAGVLPALAAGTPNGRAGDAAPGAAAQEAFAAPLRSGEEPHTVTWWCVDLNELWHVDVPVIVGAPVLTPPIPSPIPTCPTTSTFPITVTAGSGWTSGGASIWYAHTTYTPEMAAALEAIGYEFVSNSPMQDLLQKMTEVRYVVRSVPSNAIVAEHSFDPRQNFRLVRTREFFGELELAPTVVPELGIDLSSEAMGRLPLIHFPAVGEGLPPGLYRAQVIWVLSALHNDGLGMNPGNFLPPGSLPFGNPLFMVVP